MPVGLVTDDEFFSELASYRSNGSVRDRQNSVSIPNPDFDIPSVEEGIVEQVRESRGRKRGDNNVPASLRATIAETHLLDGRHAALELASEFGISPSSVSAYAKGATSTKSYHEPKESIVNPLNAARQRAMKKAAKTLNGALKAITQDKLDYTDAKDLAGIARDMSVLIKNLEPQQAVDGEGKGGPQFVIFAPQFRDERSFETIQVVE